MRHKYLENLGLIFVSVKRKVSSLLWMLIQMIQEEIELKII